VVSGAMKIEIYVEGGGDRNNLKTECRKGFTRFFDKAGLTGHLPKVIACGGRTKAFDMFRTAIENPEADLLPLLLVDSEGPVNDQPWRHLSQRDGWKKPDAAVDDQAHLMVQCMETWFLADRELLARFFGKGFRASSLPQQTRKIEEIDRKLVYDRIAKATSPCRSKGTYDKRKHSFVILGQLDPDKVSDASPHARRLIDALKKYAQGARES
jgi:hypothetical protein